MYKVMLVDDEYLELELLERHIDWESLGFLVSATAKNGKDALAKIELDKPDVLVTDVRMSFMDGIELSKAVHQTYPEIRIIFLSGYNQFEYMKAALHVNAMDYLMKPVELDELRRLMAAVKKRCDEDRGSLHSDKTIIADWMRRMYDDKENILQDDAEKLLHSFSNCFPGVHFFYITLLVINELKFLTGIDGNKYFTLSRYQKMFSRLAGCVGGVLAAVRESKYVLITSGSPEAQVCEWKQENQGLQEFVTVCLYRNPIEPNSIPEILSDLERYSGRYVYRNGPGQIIFYQEWSQSEIPNRPADYPGKKFSQILEAVRQNKVQEIEKLVADFYAEPDVDDLHNQTMNLLDRLYASSVLSPNVAELHIRLKPSFFNHLLGIESIALLKSIVTRHITALALDTDKAIQADSHILIVRRIKEYIEMNCDRAFSIEELGQAVNYSPNYLRSIYKKYTGDTVLETLTKERMRRAEKLLLDSKLTIRKISQMVGYTNPSYFCMQFLKQHGITPQQYRTGGLQ